MDVNVNANVNLSYSTKTLQDYEVLSVIGNGAFGTCYKVRDKITGFVYAWKGVDYDELTDQQKASLISEINVLRQLQHPNIVQYYHHLINPEAKSIFIVMECCVGGDLAQLIGKAKREQQRFEERYIWRILFQICRALQLCHNKMKEGIILHRDIKPANIFLDDCGNAKLGDFGLARVLRRHENFAESFVGTPYYMSPEVIMGMKYDQKSDVWAVGCLIYEMCSLRPPFRGRKLTQLSANITLGKFNNIPKCYSRDLQEMISFMLVVECEQRPNIDMISRHPVVIRNINDLGNEFPTLIPNHDFNKFGNENDNGNGNDNENDNEKHDYCILKEGLSKQHVSRKLELEYNHFNDFTSTMIAELAETNANNDVHDNVHDGNISGIMTPDLRAELFYSTRHKIFPYEKFHSSDPELYESVRRIEKSATSPQTNENVPNRITKSHPATVTAEIFEAALQTRLHSIRAHEALLHQKEEDLLKWEQRLNEREQRLLLLEENLRQKYKKVITIAESKPEIKREPNHQSKLSTVVISTQSQSSPAPPSPPPPPVPSRKSVSKHDDTYCSIESNDILIHHEPTIRKLNLNNLPSIPKLRNETRHLTSRRVTFQTPKKVLLPVVYNDIDVISSIPSSGNNNNNNNNNNSKNVQMQMSISSGKTSEESTSASTSTGNMANHHHHQHHHRRKTFLSLLGLNRNSKQQNQSIASSSTKTQKSSSINCQNASNNKTITTTTTVTAKVNNKSSLKKSKPILMNDENLVTKCQTPDFGNIWTKETKRAAFEMLATMNATAAATASTAASTGTSATDNRCRDNRNKMRQSLRERNAMQRNHYRRSLVAISGTNKHLIAQRDHHIML